MKTRIITISAIAGFLIGASALSVFANSDNWQGPCDNPPKCNVAAPLNVGNGTPLLNLSGIQEKTDSLIIDGGLNVRGNLILASGTPTAGEVLTSIDSIGTVSWQPANSTVQDTCTLVAATSPTVHTVAANVPNVCINNECGIIMAVINSSTNLVDSVTSASIIELTDSARTKKGVTAYWWSKTGAGHDGTDCAAGRNGTTEGCDRLLGSGRNDIYLQDDNSGIEMNTGQWSLTDNNGNFPVTQVWACE